jgi:hypothetical protein
MQILVPEAAKSPMTSIETAANHTSMPGCDLRDRAEMSQAVSAWLRLHVQPGGLLLWRVGKGKGLGDHCRQSLRDLWDRIPCCAFTAFSLSLWSRWLHAVRGRWKTAVPMIGVSVKKANGHSQKSSNKRVVAVPVHRLL